MLARREVLELSVDAKFLRYLSTLETTTARIVSGYRQIENDSTTGRDGVRQVVAALKACSKARDLQRGKEIYRNVGENVSIFISTALVDMFAKCGCLAEAREVFDRMSSRDAVSWNAIITGYAQAGASESALELYEWMQKDGLIPTGRTFVAALSACASLAVKENGQPEFLLAQDRFMKLESLARGASVHLQVVKTGQEEDVFVASTLIDLYAKCGRLVSAHRVFDAMQTPTVVSWTAMIMGHAQNGESEIALHMFAAMQSQRYRLDARTFVAALLACTGLALREVAQRVEGKLVKVDALRKGRHIHSLLLGVENSDKINAFVRNALVDMFSKCGSMLEARAVFDQAISRDVVLWNSIIHGYAQDGDGEEALEVFSRMEALCINPDTRTFVAAIGACSTLSASEEARNVNGKLVKMVSLEKGRALHSQLRKLGGDVAADLYVENSLLDMYTKCGSLVEARDVFNGMQRRSLVSWTTMISGCVQNGDCESALELFTAMKEQGLKPEARVYVAALNACSGLAAREAGTLADDENGRVLKLKSLEKGRLIHSELKENGHEQDVFVANSLVDMYSNCGCVADARLVFDKALSLGSSSVAIWTSMILGYSECGDDRTALELFQTMPEHPETRTFVAAIKACGNLSDLDIGRRVHEQIVREKPSLDHHSELIVTNTLIAFYGKCGCMAEARLIFDSVPSTRRDLVTWSSIISGYSHQGDARQVFDLFERMQQEEIYPDGVTFLSVLSACNHAGLVDDAKRWFRALVEDFSTLATIQHYSCMVDLLGRANHLEEALVIVETMPMEPDSTVWTSILASSHAWENGEAA